ncbi:HNH endonuclease [Rathayibacter sp. ZW T2_19]|uniref:HNH endonuclease n=1 Tax=Rathayibacter rubneri TaxID=2950106 RepID=A0A9X2DUI4_9MICO|nr:HNH endonuclease signature motif containing protein [Rathayibacter rubneri]MCM6761462.1 HNH endonuclease [Rathayibacter rubneri]
MTSPPPSPTEAVAPATVRALSDLAARLARSTAPILLARATALHAAHRAALAVPESFARGGGLSRSEAGDLVERSVRAEIAVALGVSERAATRMLEHAQLLIEHLPRTRAALAEARILWESGEVICATASTLPAESRASFDERAAEAAPSTTPTQLRRVVARLRDELHEQPLAQRHARAREDRGVWVSPEIDGMATLCALLPATTALGAYHRLDRIARSLRDGAAEGAGPGSGDQRTLAQLRADACADLLCDGDVTGTPPPSPPCSASDGVDDGIDRTVGNAGDAVTPTFVPGVRAEVRLTLAASTAIGHDDAPAVLDGYGLVPAGLARELIVEGASLTRVLTDPESGAVVSVGRTRRVPPPRMRLALQLRDRTCRFPGCTRSATTAEADHTIEWRHGGETALDNLASLCTSHHHVRHGDRWTYVLHPDGTADWTTPTGRRVSTRAPALVAPRRTVGSERGPRFDDPPPF